MSQSWFFCRVSLSKFSLNLSTFRGYKGIYSSVCEECEKTFFCKTGHSGDSVLRVVWVASLSRELIARPDCQFLSCSTPVVGLFIFLYASHVWHFGELLVASHSRDLVERNLQMRIHLNLFTHSHTQPLHNFHLNTGYLIAKITSKFGKE